MKWIVMFLIVSLISLAGCGVLEALKDTAENVVTAGQGAGAPPGLDPEEEANWGEWLAWLGSLVAGGGITGGALLSMKNSEPDKWFGPVLKSKD